MRVPPPSARALLALAAGWAVCGCSLQDPDGTRWTTTLSVDAAPETLFVADVLDHESVTLEGDTLLVFRQELEPSYANLGDSLVWGGARGLLRLESGPLDLSGMGLEAGGELPFATAWPQYASLVGQTSRITGDGRITVSLPLPALPAVDWIAFRSASFEVQVQHAWPFALDGITLDWVGAEGAALGSVELGGGVPLPPGVPRVGVLSIQGLMRVQDRLRLTLHHLPMEQAALIQDLPLSLELVQRTGSADSARVAPPEMDRLWGAQLSPDPRLVLRHALTAPARLDVRAVNALGLPVDVEMQFPQLLVSDQRPLTLESHVDAGGDESDSWNPGALEVDEPTGLAALELDIRAHSAASAQLTTLRARDVLWLDVDLRGMDLEEFEGWFNQDLLVPFEPSHTQVEDWPEELTALEIGGLPLRLEFDYTGGAPLATDLRLKAADSRLGRADTTFRVELGVEPGDTLLTQAGAGLLVSRLPRQLELSGQYRIAAGEAVALDRSSRAGVRAIRLPARLRVDALRWESVPERHSESLPEEAEHLRLRGRVENRLPAGGVVRGWVARSVDAPRVPLFELEVAEAGWEDGDATPVVTPLDVALDEDALAILEEGDWLLWYQFDADPAAGEIAVESGQFLAIQARIDVVVDVEVGEDAP